MQFDDLPRRGLPLRWPRRRRRPRCWQGQASRPPTARRACCGAHSPGIEVPRRVRISSRLSKMLICLSLLRRQSHPLDRSPCIRGDRPAAGHLVGMFAAPKFIAWFGADRMATIIGHGVYRSALRYWPEAPFRCNHRPRVATYAATSSASGRLREKFIFACGPVSA